MSGAGSSSQTTLRKIKPVFHGVADVVRCPWMIMWRRGGDSNPRSHEGSRDFESRRLNQTPEPLRNRSAFTFAGTQSRKGNREHPRDRTRVRFAGDMRSVARSKDRKPSCSREVDDPHMVTNTDNESKSLRNKTGTTFSYQCCALCDPCAIRNGQLRRHHTSDFFRPAIGPDLGASHNRPIGRFSRLAQIC